MNDYEEILQIIYKHQHRFPYFFSDPNKNIKEILNNILHYISDQLIIKDLHIKKLENENKELRRIKQ